MLGSDAAAMLLLTLDHQAAAATCTICWAALSRGIAAVHSCVFIACIACIAWRAAVLLGSRVAPGGSQVYSCHTARCGLPNGACGLAGLRGKSRVNLLQQSRCHARAATSASLLPVHLLRRSTCGRD